MSAFYLSDMELQAIEATMADLKADGVEMSRVPSGEMNFSGCASGYCQAWA